MVTASFNKTVRQMTECFSDQNFSARNDRNVSVKKNSWGAQVLESPLHQFLTNEWPWPPVDEWLVSLGSSHGCLLNINLNCIYLFYLSYVVLAVHHEKPLLSGRLKLKIWTFALFPHKREKSTNRATILQSWLGLEYTCTYMRELKSSMRY